MKGLNHFQYYFIPVTNQNIKEEEIQQILSYIIELPEDVAKYDINEKIISFKFDGQEYITLYDYFQLLKVQKMAFSFQIIIEITIKIFDSLLQYNQNELQVDLSLENIWIFFGKAQTVNDQLQNLKVYLIQAQCFEAQDNILDQKYEFRRRLKQEIQNFQSQNKMKVLCEQFFSAINNPDVQTVKIKLQEIKIKEHPNTQLTSLEKEIIYLNGNLYAIFSYITKLGDIFRDNLMNWIIKDINLKYVFNIQDLFEILNFLRLQEIQTLLLYLKEQQLNIDENMVTVYLCKGKFLNSLEDLRKFKFPDLLSNINQQNQSKKQFDEVNNLQSYFNTYYPNFSQQLKQYSSDYLKNLKQISDKTIEIINQKINSRINEMQNITEIYKINLELFNQWFDNKIKNQILEQTMKLIEQNLLDYKIQFEKLNDDENLIYNCTEQSIEEITMQLIMKKNEEIVKSLLYQQEQF